jgi:hypothetical protein
VLVVVGALLHFDVILRYLVPFQPASTSSKWP